MSKATALSVIALILGSCGFGTGLYFLITPGIQGPAGLQGEPGEPGEPGAPGLPGPGNVLQVLECSSTVNNLWSGSTWATILGMSLLINVTNGSRLLIYYTMTLKPDVGRDQFLRLNVSTGYDESLNPRLDWLIRVETTSVFPVTLMLVTEPLPAAWYFVTVYWHPNGGPIESYGSYRRTLTVLELGA